MPANIGVLDYHQASTEIPKTFIPSDVAAELVRRLIAEQLSRRVIRVFGPESPFPVLKAQAPPREFHSAGTLPPGEVPGCYFQLPQSHTWKEQHRTVSFMQHF